MSRRDEFDDRHGERLAGDDLRVDRPGGLLGQGADIVPRPAESAHHREVEVLVREEPHRLPGLR
jgi:hypothetical protein